MHTSKGNLGLQRRHDKNSTLAQLRAFIPSHPLAHGELIRLIEVQALHLVSLTAPAERPDDAIRAVPAIQLTSTKLEISGFSYWDRHRWIVCLNGAEPARRRRFTLSHEFAHIVWHGFEHRLFPGLTGQARAHLAELAANYFAGNVLVPPEDLRLAWHRGVRNIDRLADLFDVSTETIRVSLAQHGLRPDPQLQLPFLRARPIAHSRPHSRQLHRLFTPSRMEVAV